MNSENKVVVFESGTFLEVLNPVDGYKKRISNLMQLDDYPFLIKKPDNIVFNHKHYRIDKEGLYRFIVPEESIRNVIFYKDPISLLSSLVLLQVHGGKDDSRAVDMLYSCLREISWLSMTCGPFCDLLKYVFNTENINSRKVLISSGENA